MCSANAVIYADFSLVCAPCKTTAPEGGISFEDFDEMINPVRPQCMHASSKGMFAQTLRMDICTAPTISISRRRKSSAWHTRKSSAVAHTHTHTHTKTLTGLYTHVHTLACTHTHRPMTFTSSRLVVGARGIPFPRSIQVGIVSRYFMI